MAENISLFGIYCDFNSLRDCVASLKSLDYRTQDISLVFPEDAMSETFSVPGGSRNARAGREGSRSNALVVGSLGWLTYVSPPTPGELGMILAGLGVPAYVVERYENRIRNGGILVSVRCFTSALAARLREVMRETGAQEISSRRNMNMVRKTNEYSRRVHGRISRRSGDTPMLRRSLIEK